MSENKYLIYAGARFKPRSGTAAEWAEANPILAAGEPGVVIDGTETEKIKFGDGTTPWNKLGWWRGPRGEQGPRGEDGVAPTITVKDYKDATRTGQRFEITYPDGKTEVFIIYDGQQGPQGPKGDSANVDQTYNPNSENAQSGKAVAEAIANIETLKSQGELVGRISINTEEGIYLLRSGSVVEVEETVIFNNGKKYSTETMITPLGEAVADMYVYVIQCNKAQALNEVHLLFTGLLQRDGVTEKTPMHYKLVSGVDKASGLDYSIGEELNAKVDQAYNHESTNPQSGKAVAEAIANIKVSGGGYVIGDGLKLDTSTNTLSVDTVDKAEQDNTQPITSAAVFAEIGNINTLLENI